MRAAVVGENGGPALPVLQPSCSVEADMLAAQASPPRSHSHVCLALGVPSFCMSMPTGVEKGRRVSARRAKTARVA